MTSVCYTVYDGLMASSGDPIFSVRFPRALADRIDAARGKTSRTEWLRNAAETLLTHPFRDSGKEWENAAPGEPWRPGPPTSEIPPGTMRNAPPPLTPRSGKRQRIDTPDKPSDCKHPPTSRLGSTCILCGTEVKSKP